MYSFSSRLFTLGIGFGLLAAPALADPDSPAERRQERAEVRESQQELRDDQVDLRQLNDIVEDWHRARARRDRAAERRADARIEVWIRKELAESRTEVREAQQEVANSQREVRTEQHDAARAQRRGQHNRAAHERAELRDDKRDLADDKQDLTGQRQDLNRLRGVAQDLDQIQRHFRGNRASPAQYARKSALLRELQSLARAEVRDTRTEVREDKQELREDRR